MAGGEAITEEYRASLLSFDRHQSRRCDLERPKCRWKQQKHLQDQEEYVSMDLKLHGSLFFILF
jgi:hypothetical protein